MSDFLDDLIKNFSSEKTTFERENKIDSFKTKIKPIMGKSIKDEDFSNIIKLKNEKFENSIKDLIK